MSWHSPSPCWLDPLQETQIYCCTPHPQWALFFNANCNDTGSWVGPCSPPPRPALSPVCWHSSPSSLSADLSPLQGNKRAQGGAAGLLACPEQEDEGSQDPSPRPTGTPFQVHTQEPGTPGPEPNGYVSCTTILTLTFVGHVISAAALLFTPTFTGADFMASFSPGFMGEGFGISLLAAA